MTALSRGDHDLRRGSWYTPQVVAGALVKMATEEVAAVFGGVGGIRVVDPAVGDGVFPQELVAAGFRPEQMVLVDVDEDAITKVADEFLSAEVVAGNAAFYPDLGVGDSAGLVIGNPPWGASKDAGAGTKESRWLWKLVRDYVDTGHAKQGLVGDVCYHFLRLGQWLVENNTAGVVAMVLNNSFVDAPTGSRLRRVLLDTFDKIQVVDLGGNARRHEKGNVFGVRVGVALLVLTRNQGRGTQEVEYTRVEGTVEEKLEWLRKL